MPICPIQSDKMSTKCLLYLLCVNILFTRMLQKFAEDFDGRIEGKAKVMKQTEKLELSGGAKISSIFRVRFPGDVSRVEYNERKLRKEIGFAIKTSQG